MSEDYIQCGNKRYAPISLSFITSESAPPGAHTILISLTYKTKSASDIANTHVVIHITSFIERHQVLITIVIAVLFFAAEFFIFPSVKGKRLLQMSSYACIAIILSILIYLLLQ